MTLVVIVATIVVEWKAEEFVGLPSPFPAYVALGTLLIFIRIVAIKLMLQLPRRLVLSIRLALVDFREQFDGDVVGEGEEAGQSATPRPDSIKAEIGKQRALAKEANKKKFDDRPGLLTRAVAVGLVGLAIVVLFTGGPYGSPLGGVLL